MNEHQIWFSCIPKEIARDKRLSKNTSRVLTELIGLINFKSCKIIWPNGSYKVTVKREIIAIKLGIHANDVTRATTKLQSLGWLKKEGKGGWSRESTYSINVPECLILPSTQAESTCTTQAESTCTTQAESTCTTQAESTCTTQAESTCTTLLEQEQKFKEQTTTTTEDTKPEVAIQILGDVKEKELVVVVGFEETTTTKQPAPENFCNEQPQRQEGQNKPFHWPDCLNTDEDRRKAAKMLADCGELAQSLLDEMRANEKDGEIRKPLAYLYTLVEKLKDGKFVPTVSASGTRKTQKPLDLSRVPTHPSQIPFEFNRKKKANAETERKTAELQTV